MATLARPVQWLFDFFRGFSSDGENRLSENAAISYAPIWYSVNKIAGHIGQLPVHFYRRLDGGAERVTEDARYQLMKSKPNPYQTAFTFKQQVQAHALLWGNGRAYIHRVGRTVREVIPILPDRTMTVMIEGSKYHLTKPEGWDRLKLFENPSAEMRDVIILDDADVIHVPGFGFDGVEGLSLLSVAARSWNAGISGDKRYNTQTSKGFAAKFMLEAPSGAFRNEQDAKNFMEAFNRYHGGPENADKVGLLREGVKLQTLSMSNQDAQFLENRKYQRQEAALWFLLESIIGDDQSVSYNSLEQKNLAYLSNCLMSWIVKWEQELDSKLLTSREKAADSHYFKFNTAALLRSDYSTTMASLATAIQNRIMNPNEARAALEMNPYDGGDDYYNPATTSGNSQVEDDSPEDDTEEDVSEDSTEDTQVSDVERKTIKSHLEHLLGVEKKRLLQGAKEPLKFVNYMTKFYDRFENTLGNAISKFCTNSDLAKQWCGESKSLLLQLCDHCQPEDLETELQEVLATWNLRLETLVEKVAKDV